MGQLKTRPCEDCGKPTTKDRPSRAGWLCMTCAVARALEANRQLMHRQGPIYRKWKRAQRAGNLAWAQKLLKSKP